MDLGLRGARALVTGGNRGIGRAIASVLVAEGADVVLLARDREALAVAAAQTGARGFVTADTGDDAAVRVAVDEAAALLGGLDIVVNCAATRAKPGAPGLEGVVDDEFLGQLDTKALGYLRVTRAAAPHLRDGGGGQVVNIAGMNARMTGNISGTVRNLAVVGVTKSLADDLGPSGVSVICLHPGFTITEANAGIEEYERLASNNSLRHPITAAEVADVAVFLASPRGRIANGAVVTVDGGHPGLLWA